MELSTSAEFDITSGKDYDALFSVPAVIIYPALMTPAIVTGDESLELLILGHDDFPLTVDAVNWQLKIGSELNLEKNCSLNPLFSEETLNPNDGSPCPIVVEKLDKIGNVGKIFETEKRFKGIISHWVFNNYDEKLRMVYKVSIKGFKQLVKKVGMHSVFWLRSQDEAFILHEQEDVGGQLFNFNKEVESELVKKVTVNGQTQEIGIRKKWLVAKGMADTIMRQVLKEMKTLDKKDKDLYGISDTGVKNIKCPIQAIHPVFYYTEPQHFNIFHFTDLHVSLRQKILAKSQARVIEYQENGESFDLGVSPPIGSLVNTTSDNIVELFNYAGSDDKVDMVCITGDLIDYICNVYLEDGEENEKLSVTQVWNKVSLKKASYKERYKEFVDFVAFYTMVINFYQDHGKPVFVISGNHDCYHEPYGSSPRLSVIEKLTNEGIPADHNLTLYEAMVIFGDTYGTLYKEHFTSNFDKKNFKWMYSVLTPLSDFAIKLPKQCLIGLEWGDEEDLLGDAPWSAHGFGHLPRSKAGVTKKQLELIKRAIKWERRNILMSHFTFVSYKDSIPLFPEVSSKGYSEGTIDTDYGFVSSNHTSDYDLGTFHENRSELYDVLLHKEKLLQIVLTGHSHRRGLYTITDFESNWVRSNKVKTRFLDFYQFNTIKGKDEAKSLIIVSDSGGPLPRHNRYGEFKGWGSDRASGTRILFDQKTGEVENISAVKVGPKPRLVVALDYTDLFGTYTGTEVGNYGVQKVKKEVNVIPPVESIEYDEDDIGVEPVKIDFPFDLFDKDNTDYILEKSVLNVVSIGLYRLADSGNVCEKYEMEKVDSGFRWRIPEKNTEDFTMGLKFRSKDEKWFLSVGFFVKGTQNIKNSLNLSKLISERYIISDNWCFECHVSVIGMFGMKKAAISRDKKSAKKSDANWRNNLSVYQ